MQRQVPNHVEWMQFRAIIILLDFFLQSCLEKFQQQVFFAVVRSVVVNGQNDRLHEVGRAAGRHLEDKLAEVGRVGLKSLRSLLTVKYKKTQ